MKKHFKLFVTILVIALVTPVIGHAYCPLGDDVTKDLVGVLRIMKILAPLLVIIYSTYEAVLAVTQGKIEEESKKLFTKFAKRAGAALLLFAIPVIVDAMMQLLNVWDDEGHCVLEPVQTTGVDINTTESCSSRCSHIGDETGRQACLKNCTTTTTETCEQRCGHIGDESGRQACLRNCTTTTTETCEQRCGHIGDETGRQACLSNCKTTNSPITIEPIHIN